MERLYLDTNVLFPMTLMDLMLSMAEDFHHDLLWSDFLLEEWERVVVRERRRTPDQASAITGAIRQAFPSGRIAPDDYESIIETVPGPDPDDRVHGAAALAGGATALITANLRHFDGEFFANHGVIVETPESYLVRACRSRCAGPRRAGRRRRFRWPAPMLSKGTLPILGTMCLVTASHRRRVSSP